MEFEHFKEYFDYSTESKKTTCKVIGCNRQYSGYRTSNLWRHLETAHSDIYQKLLPQRQVRKKSKHENFVLDMRKALVELCSVNGRPLAIVEDSGIVQILRIACNAAGDNLSDFRKINVTGLFTREQVKMDIETANSFIQNQIRSEVKNILVSLMVDIRSKRGKSILGMQIQYIKNDQIKIRTVGMVRMLKPHTGAYIAELIEKKLKEYSISLDQIYSLTTDNGANMLKAVSLVGKDVRDTLTALMESDEMDDEQPIDTAEFETLAFIIADETNDNGNSSRIILNEEALNEATGIMLSGNSTIETTMGLNCGAHTLQLEIFASIKLWDNETGLLNKCRAIMVKIKNQNILDILVSRNLNLPITDCNPRWWTFHLMVSTIY